MSHSIHLPFPPTTNTIWRLGRNKTIHRNQSYVQWIEQADQLTLLTKRGPIKMLVGPFFALLELHTTDKRRRKDADNRWKAVLDYATRIGLIQDDCHMQWGLVGWVDDATVAPPYGCRLTIWPCKKKGPPNMATLIAEFGQKSPGENGG